ncbi:MAG: ABC transporter permease [Opitutaceae bacterium]|nr:ABC transporter permease [Opitutaceae bacterium]
MIGYVIRRVLHMLPTLFLISLVSFIVIQAPPGDMLTAKLARLEEEMGQGRTGSREEIAALRAKHHLDEPLVMQYLHWIGAIVLHGDFGDSFTYEMKVMDLFRNRLGMTFLLTLATLVCTWVVAIPLGIYSATHQNQTSDYVFTLLGFLGVATPNFLIALVFMFVQATVFEASSVGGLLSPAFVGAPLSWAKAKDFLDHLWLPVVVIGSAGTASVMRIMRGNLIDVLTQQHIQTGRAKGLAERVVVWKYGVRIAINPLISRLGLELPHLFSGAVVISIVLGLPTAGPIFLTALTTQDMYLAGAFLLLSATFLLVGNLLADILLAWVDPRIRYE